MGACSLTPQQIVVDLADTGTSGSSVRIDSGKRVHDLRRAVAELTHISPHMVEVWQCTGESKKILGHNDPLQRRASKARISVTLKQSNVAFFTSSADGSAKQHDALTGECLATYEHPAAVNSLCLSKCGCFVFTACDDGVCRKFDDLKATVIKSYHSKCEPLVHVALSPCGKFLYTCTRTSTADKFDEKTGQLLCVFFDHVSGNPALALSSCGTYIFKTTTSHVAKKYNWQTGEVLATYGRGETDVLGVALGRSEGNDETLVFTACSDGSVKQFNESGTCVRSYQCHTDKVTWVGCR
eukprot:GEMP01024839.1.p1 GENE.GEMP01024839.1~~GEMP01024839.1.p1  ORF type:complete len:297 (+),score=43.98 GEMP01024839.1:70-960(+)